MLSKDISMKEKELLERIVVDPEVMIGKPVIKGTRLTVQFILSLLAQGMTADEILNEYTKLQKEDIFACFAFAQQALENTKFSPISI